MDRKLNILYHFRVRGTGAEGVHIAGIVNGFRKFGHHVRLVSPTGADPTVECVSKLTKEKSHTIKTKILHKLANILPQPLFELMEIFYNIFALLKLRKCIKEVRPNFIYERYAFFNVAGAVVSKLYKIPLVLEVNEMSGHKRVRGQLFVKLCSFLEKITMRQASLIITVSDFLNQEVRRKVDSPQTQVVTIPNGVPEKWLDSKIDRQSLKELRQQYGLGEKKVICFVGGLVYWHNFPLLLKAVKKVQILVPGSVLLIVGDGPLKDYIKEQTIKLGLDTDSVILSGMVSHSEIPLYLSLADVAVIPETNNFRSPIKMFEYMALGKAVIAPRKPPIETVIEDGIDGALFEPGDENLLAEAILRCLQIPLLSRQFGSMARKKISERYTWERHVEHILQMIQHDRYENITWRSDNNETYPKFQGSK